MTARVSRIGSAQICSLALCAMFVVTLAPWPARAGCTTRSDATAVLRSARRAAKCNNRWLRRGPAATCEAVTPPVCAGSLVGDAIALAYGANNPPAAAVDRRLLSLQLGCQQLIGRAVATFVGVKLRYLVKGFSAAEAEAKARRKLDRLPDHCAVTVALDVSGVVLPDVGPQCDAAVGAPGSAVNATSLRDALVTLLETWVDRVGPNPQPLKPNIVLILTDDQRFDTVGPLHSVNGTTPVMQNVVNQIANQGVMFANSFVTTALCAPSRTSMLAGKYSHTTGVHDNAGSDGGVGVFNDSSTLPVWLNAAGYHTGIFGKYINGYAPISPYVAPGWDEWHVFKAPGYYTYTLVENGTEVPYGSTDADYATDVLRDKVVQFIQSSTTPFFVEFTPYAPHAPATPATRHLGTFSAVPLWRPPNYAEPDVSDKPAWVQGLFWDAADQSETDAFRQTQLECLQAVDEAVNAIIAALSAKGVLNNTIVVFAADNGYAWGSHRWKPKQCPYEECMRVPLIVRYPALAPLPRTENGIGLNIDYSETFAELAGATPDPGVEGRSMVRLLDGTEPAWRTDSLNEHWNGIIPTNAQVRGLFSNGGPPSIWKYVEYVTVETELYGLLADPSELSNATNDSANAALKSTMAARLRELYPGWTGGP